MDIEPKYSKELRIFKRVIANEYSSNINEMYGKDSNELNILISKYRQILVENEGLSDEWLDIICSALRYCFINLYHPFLQKLDNVRVENEGEQPSSINHGIVDNISYALTNPVNPYQVRGEWQLLAPFTKYEVIYNPFGVIPLNPVLCHKYGGIRFTLRVDVLTGVGVLSIRGYTSDIAIDSPLINQQTALVGLPIPIGRQRDNLLSVFSDVGLMAAGAGAAAAADTTASSIAAISSMASASVRFTGDLLSQNAAFIGKSSSVAGNSTQLVYQVTYTDPQTENNDDLGRPLCEARLLSTLSGFTVCADGEIDNVGMLAEERELINKYLTTGFYIA